ncbi:nck-associated protein 5-like [Limulus polyphemus]|uniref:Nck-associated protein 5-like n=1 Tax=Limulus polyphemus TaxID=6850 RepID=A0ABM1T4X2_LIMPO|nr:nck-associated protein 5-like [Limulus polyphemus]XP_022250928.1 nck-associated protein 5-like [Limulus polyphemus]
MHRLEAEACLREVRLESEHCKARLASLQEDFLKMEEMVKNMLQFKSRIDQLKHEKSSLALAYESKMRKYQTCLASLEKENLMLLNELRSLEGSNKDHEQKREQTLCRVLLERLGLLEQENTALIIENEQQRLQYEHCLDDVANQVVQALLTQKSLREECGKLQRRVQDLEQQNNALSVLFKQQVLHSGEFHSQLYHRDSLQKIWPSTDNSPDQDTVDLILADRLQNLEFGQYNQNQSQRTGRNFQSHANHSEDSTDSLASLCSDYSFNSGCSGRNVLSYPGLPKMSSPPQWSRDSLTTLGYSVKPQVSSTGVLARSLLTSTPQGCHRTSMTKCWSDLVPRPSDQDCYSRDEVCNYALQAEQLELRESHKLHKSYGNRNMLVDKVCGRLKSDVARSSSLLDSEIHQAEYNLSSQSQSVDLGSLDTIETPSEHILTLESLPYLSSSQRLLISKECNFPNFHKHIKLYKQLLQEMQMFITNHQQIGILLVFHNSFSIITLHYHLATKFHHIVMHVNQNLAFKDPPL